MEWIETSSKSIEEAKELALDKLGVDTAEAEFEVLEEPRQGLFGRTRGEARVRARIAPQTPRDKDDRGRRRRKPRSSSKSDGSGTSQKGEGGQNGEQSAKSAANGQNTPSAGSGGGRNKGGNRKQGRGTENRSDRSKRPPRSNAPKKEDASMDEVQACVQTFLDGIVESFGIDTTVDIDTSNDEIMARIDGKHGLLLGPKARTLDAIQELTRVTAQRTVPSSIRIKVDVGGYREARNASLQSFAREAGDKAVAESVEILLEPMSSADRKVVHDELGDFPGVTTRSAGTDPRRRVVVVPEELTSEVVVSDEDSGDAAEGAD